MTTDPRLTFVVPTLREHTFGESLDLLLESLAKTAAGPVEILVVDDSDPAAFAALERTVAARRDRLAAQVSVEVLAGPRLGKGAAVRVGALASRGEIVFVVDADMPVPLRFVDVFLGHLAEGVDIVIGTRDPDRYAGDPVRQVLARGLLALQTAMVFHRRLFADTQCGFKAFRGDVLRALARDQSTKGGMYDLEYLYAARQRGLRIAQVPVELRGEVRPSRINLLRCIVVDPLEIFYFKGRGALGRYRGPR